MLGDGDVGLVLVGGDPAVDAGAFAARATGVASVVASLSVGLAPSASSTGTSVVAAGLGVARPLVAAQATGTATASATTDVQRRLVGSSAALATVTGNLTVEADGQVQLAASAAGSSVVSGGLSGTWALATSVVGQSTVQLGAARVARALAAAVVGLSEASAILSVKLAPKIGLRAAAARVDFH